RRRGRSGRAISLKASRLVVVLGWSFRLGSTAFSKPEGVSRDHYKVVMTRLDFDRRPLGGSIPNYTLTKIERRYLRASVVPPNQQFTIIRTCCMKEDSSSNSARTILGLILCLAALGLFCLIPFSGKAQSPAGPATINPDGS